MKWFKKAIDYVLQHTVGEPWDEMPFEMNMGWFVDLYREREIAREVVTQADLDIIAKYLFKRSYFEKTGDWATRYTLEDFNKALQVRMREYKFPCDVIYHRLSMTDDIDHLDKTTIKYSAEYRDLTLVSDTDLHEVMAI